jgi:polyisoprenoid-binding protein YceI
MSEHSAEIARLVAGSYRLDPARSQVHYSGKHMFGLGTVRATFAVREGSLEVGDPITASSATVIVDAGSFTSNNARRDKDVRAAGLLDAETYPDITFTSQRVLEADHGLLVSGHVTAHGQSVQVELHVDGLTQEDTGIRVHARAERLDRTALGVTGSKGMVGRYLDLELDAFARPV